MESPERTAIRHGLDELKVHLESYVADTLSEANVPASHTRTTSFRRGADIQKLINEMLSNWQDVFAKRLPLVVRSYLYELRDIRNRWAHEEPFSRDEAARALSTISLVAKATGAEGFRPPTAPVLDAPSPHRAASHGLRSARRMSQRAVMRELFVRYRGDAERVIQEYAAAERRGDVMRKQNTSGLTPEAYARALFADGEKKGWLNHTD
jgi:hypothetical protein